MIHIAYSIFSLSLHDALPILGTHIPILEPGELPARRPDVVLILPWNIADEVKQQQAIVRDWGGDRKSTRLNSSQLVFSYGVFCLKKKKVKWCCDSYYLIIFTY